MGKRARRRGAVDRLEAPTVTATGPDGDMVLHLRTALSPASRQEYAAAFGGSPLSREDAWQRAVEFLFERLVSAWEVAGTEPLVRQRDLLARYRFASADERRWIRDVLRAHLAEHFPEMAVP